MTSQHANRFEWTPAEESTGLPPRSRRGMLSPLALDQTLLFAQRLPVGWTDSAGPQQLDLAGWQEETFPVLIASVHGI